MKALQPEWEVGLLSSVTIGDLTRLEADFFAINANFATRSLVGIAHQRQRKVLVWTVNDRLSMSALMSKGVDGIITDNPGLAVTVKEERAEMELVERLLIQVANFLGQPPPRPEQ
jgi:glycerophosphoryl diester phosphodiesterase